MKIILGGGLVLNCFFWPYFVILIHKDKTKTRP